MAALNPLLKTELCVGVTPMFCFGLVKNRVYVSEFSVWNFTTSTNTSDGVVLYRIIATLPV